MDLMNDQVNHLRNGKAFKFFAQISPRSKMERNHTKLNAYEMFSLNYNDNSKVPDQFGCIRQGTQVTNIFYL